jgi:hypothetical protein
MFLSLTASTLWMPLVLGSCGLTAMAVHDGAASSMAKALSTTRDERRLWEIVGAHGLSCFIAPVADA